MRLQYHDIVNSSHFLQHIFISWNIPETVDCFMSEDKLNFNEGESREYILHAVISKNTSH